MQKKAVTTKVVTAVLCNNAAHLSRALTSSRSSDLRFSKHIASAADTKPSQVSPMTDFRTRGVASALTAAVPSMIYTWFPILPVKCDLSQSTRSI